MRGEADERELDQPLSPKKEKAFEVSMTRAALLRGRRFKESPKSTRLALIVDAVHHRSWVLLLWGRVEAVKARVDTVSVVE